jgi:hypothetical protein
MCVQVSTLPLPAYYSLLFSANVLSLDSIQNNIAYISTNYLHAKQGFLEKFEAWVLEGVFLCFFTTHMSLIVFHEMPPLHLTKSITLTFYFSKINFNILLLSVSGLSLLEIFHSNFLPLFSFIFLYVTHGIATERKERVKNS